jgi:hypothetical protein
MMPSLFASRLPQHVDELRMMHPSLTTSPSRRNADVFVYTNAAFSGALGRVQGLFGRPD